jgi:hypothetical protein
MSHPSSFLHRHSIVNLIALANFIAPPNDFVDPQTLEMDF